MRLLADAEAAEDHAEQVVGAELTGNAGKLALRQPQFLGEKIQHRIAPCGVQRGDLEMRARLAQRLQMPLPRQVNVFTNGRPVPAGQPIQLLAQQLNTLPVARREENRVAFDPRGIARQVDLVHHRQQRYAAPRACGR